MDAPRRDLGRRASGWLGWLALALAILPLVLVVLGKGLGLEKPSFWGDGFVGGVWGSAVTLAIGAAIARGLGAPGTRREGGTLDSDGSARAGRPLGRELA
jgi:hypothetical protein